MRIDLRDVLSIEQRKHSYWVVDKREANVREAGPFATFWEASTEWQRQANSIVLGWATPETSEVPT